MKKLALPSIVLLLLAGVAVWLWMTRSQSSTLNLSDFSVADTAAVSRIFLSDKNGATIDLVREGKQWKLNGKYTARQDAINILLSTLSGLAVKSTVPNAARENVLKNLAGNSTAVTIFADGEELKTIVVGGATPNHTGTYMLIKGSDRPYVTYKPGFTGFLTPRFFTNEGDWRDRTLLGFARGSIHSVRVEHPDKPENSFEITDTGVNQFELKSLATGELVGPFDTARVVDFVNRFHQVPFESYEQTSWLALKDSILATTPLQVYTVTDTNGDSKTVRTWRKPIGPDAADMQGNPIYYDLERMVATSPNDEYVVVQYHIFDALSLSLSDFVRK